KLMRKKLTMLVGLLLGGRITHCTREALSLPGLADETAAHMDPALWPLVRVRAVFHIEQAVAARRQRGAHALDQHRTVGGMDAIDEGRLKVKRLVRCETE